MLSILRLKGELSDLHFSLMKLGNFLPFMDCIIINCLFMPCGLSFMRTFLIFLTLHLYVIYRFKVQTVPGLWWFDLKFFDFTVVRKQYVFGRNKIQILNFDLFQTSSMCVVWCNFQLADVIMKSTTDTFRTIQFFTFSIIFVRLYLIFSSLL